LDSCGNFGVLGVFAQEVYSELKEPFAEVTSFVSSTAAYAASEAKEFANAGLNVAKGVVQQVGNDVDYVIDATGKGLAHIGKVIVDNIQAGLVCLFNKALSLADITPNEFWMQVEQLGGAFIETFNENSSTDKRRD